MYKTNTKPKNIFMIESRYPYLCTQVTRLSFLVKKLHFSSVQVFWVFQFTDLDYKELFTRECLTMLDPLFAFQ